MAVSEGYKEFILEQLEPITRASVRRMFGAVGIYAGPYFFAVIDDDRLYFKVDDTNRKDYLDAGMSGFKPGFETKVSLPYYEVPGDVLEDIETLREWVAKSVAVARSKARTKVKPKPKTKPKSKSKPAAKPSLPANKKAARKKVAG